MKKTEKNYISLEHFIQLCRSLADHIIKDNFHPDLIIGISKGGWVPASFLCDYLGVDSMASIGVKSYKDIGEKMKKPVLKEELGRDISGLKVLVVDDVVDSGGTLLMLKDYLRSFRPSEVKFAALHYKPWAKMKPDYYIEETEKWLVYPWEIIEDQREKR